MPINILCNKLSLYEYRGNLYLIKDLRKINVLKKNTYSKDQEILFLIRLLERDDVEF